MAWTDEMIAELKKLWQEGVTTGEIGKRLNVSKNSIVGKVHRLGLSGRPSPIKRKDTSASETPAPKAEKKPATAKVQKSKVEKTPVPKAEKVEKVKEPEVEFIPIPPVEKAPSKAGQNVSLTDLDNHTCRWPIGDPKDDNFHFCGNKVRIGQTYCDEHAAIAYVKPTKK